MEYYLADSVPQDEKRLYCRLEKEQKGAGILLPALGLLKDM